MADRSDTRSTRTIEVPVWVAATAGGAVGALLLLLWSLKRHSPLLELPDQHGIEDLERTIAGLTQSSLCEGNGVELVQNGAFFDRMLADVAAAEHSVHLQTFLSEEGEVTRRVADALCDRARAGVAVRLLLDAGGSRRFGKDGLARLEEAGVEVSRFRGLHLRSIGRINNRDHRKLCIVDGRIGWIGGHCLSDYWLGEAEDKQHYRDVSARVRGPVVAQMQAAFAEHWIEETGETFGGDAYFPHLDRCGDTRAHVVWVTPAGAPSCVSLLYSLAIRGAANTLTLQNPYFLPDPEDRKELAAAARRGVRVRIMMPTPGASDAPIVQHASHHHYGTLLRGGVKLYDYGRTLLHQKIIVIDGKCASIGSTNFDDRSFEINDEVSLVVYDKNIAKELEDTFERDLERWQHRPWHHKLVDFSLYLVNEQL